MQIPDAGRQFEIRAIEVARAIHDPSGNQGALIFHGREHDGVFIGDREITAYEFTLEKKKDKAEKDARKIADLLDYLAALPEHRHRLAFGFVVTGDEPTADQFTIVQSVARQRGVQVKCMSFASLKKSLVDIE